MLEVQNQDVRRAMLPVKALEENPSFPLAASGGFRYSSAYSSITPISASSSHGLLPSVSAGISSLLIRTPVIESKGHPTPVSPLLN